MKYLFCLLTLSLSTILAAQTVVVPLSPEDASHLKAAKEQVDLVNKLWADLQKRIGIKYLIVEKDSPDAGDQHYYDDVTSLNGTVNGNITLSSIGDDHCLTPEERAKRDRDRAAYEEKQRLLNGEREARSKRIHKGFESERDFIFSDDWKYLLPMEKPPAPTYPYITIPTPGQDGIFLHQ